MLEEDVAFLLEDLGSSLTLTRKAAGVYTPSTGLMATTTPTTHTIRGVFIDYRTENVDGTVIRAGDRLLLVSATGSEVAPIMDDVVEGLRVVSPRAFAPNGVAVAWACQMRK